MKFRTGAAVRLNAFGLFNLLNINKNIFMDVLSEAAYFHTTSKLFSSCFYFKKVQRLRVPVVFFQVTKHKAKLEISSVTS